MTKKQTIIGVFDSGIGGLAVLEKIVKTLPAHYIYLADTAHFPYGSKSTEYIQKRCLQNTKTLLELGAETIVIACNTASTSSFKLLKKIYPSVRFFEVVQPTIKQALKETKNSRIGILATPSTVSTGIHKKSLIEQNSSLFVHEQECEGLAGLIEKDPNNTEKIARTLKKFTNPLKRVKIDTLIIGCTHYELIYELIAQQLPNVAIVQSSDLITQDMGTDYSDKSQQNYLIEYITTDKTDIRKKAALYLKP